MDTDEGIHGWGEACVGSENGEAAYAVKELIERGITPRVKGENPVEFRKILGEAVRGDLLVRTEKL